MSRGDTFRSTLKRIGEVRSILPHAVNVMALTATATKSLRSSVSKTIGLISPYVMAVCPCKENLIYSVMKANNVNDSLQSLVEELKKQRAQMRRVIVYCRRIEVCAETYMLFRDSMGSNFTEPPDAPDMTRFRLVDMYTSATDKPIKDAIIDLFFY